MFDNFLGGLNLYLGVFYAFYFDDVFSELYLLSDKEVKERTGSACTGAKSFFTCFGGDLINGSALRSITLLAILILCCVSCFLCVKK